MFSLFQVRDNARDKTNKINRSIYARRDPISNNHRKKTTEDKFQEMDGNESCVFALEFLRFTVAKMLGKAFGF